MRKVLNGEELLEVNPLFEEIAKKRGFYSEDLMMKIARTGMLENIDEVPEDVKRIFRTAHEIAPDWHVAMQAAFQRHVDNAVSKTVNLRNEASIEDVDRAYKLAYRLKCKGITVYRDKSKREQVIQHGVENVEELFKEREKEMLQLKLFPEEYVKMESTETAACREGTCD